MERGRLLEFGHLFPGSDVMRPDQRVMEALHRFSKASYAVVRRQTPTHLLHDLLTSNHPKPEAGTARPAARSSLTPLQ
jgi:hypothetical protein